MKSTVGGEMARTYVGLIWIEDAVGERFSVHAESIEEATQKLEERYGKGHTYTLYNEEDADRRR